MIIDNILDNDEKVLWQEKPVRKVYSLKSIALTFFGFFFLLPVCGFLGFPLLSGIVYNLASQSSSVDPEVLTQSGETLNAGLGIGYFLTSFNCFFVCFTLPFLIIGLSMVLNPIMQFFVWKNVQYTITSKRIILSSGLIGQDFKSVDHDQIRNISVNVGVIDKLFNENTGSIKIFSGETTRGDNGTYSVSDTMSAIRNPYDVFKQIKEVAHDIKTDIEYPNKLRPKTNPGYQTDYTPDK